MRVQGRLAKAGGGIGTRQLRNAAVNQEFIRALVSTRGTQAEAGAETHVLQYHLLHYLQLFLRL